MKSILLEQKYSFSCLMTSTPEAIKTLLTSWGKKNILPKHLVVNDDAKGLEDDPHITIKYGLTIAKPTPELLNILKNFRPFTVEINAVSLFRNGKDKGYDVVKCGVISESLRELNKMICDQIPHEDTYKDYNPHMTIAYVVPGSCDNLVGINPLGKKNEFEVTKVIFSGSGDDKDFRIKQEINLFDISYKTHF